MSSQWDNSSPQPKSVYFTARWHIHMWLSIYTKAIKEKHYRLKVIVPPSIETTQNSECLDNKWNQSNSLSI